jgi:hypothetical protein
MLEAIEHQLGEGGGDPVVGYADSRVSDPKAVLLMHDGVQEPIQRSMRSDSMQTLELVRRLLDDKRFDFTLLDGGVEAGLEEAPATGETQDLASFREL